MRAAVGILAALLLAAAALWWLTQDDAATIDDGSVADTTVDEQPRAGLDGTGSAIDVPGDRLPARSGGGVIRGHVEDAASAPIPDVRLEIRLREEQTFRDRRPGAWLERAGVSERYTVLGSTRSDANGDFVMTGLPNGSYRVTAFADAPWFSNETWASVGTAWAPQVVRLVLGQGAVVRLRVVDGVGHGLRASLRGHRERDAPETEWFPWSFSALGTDADGRVAVLAPEGTLRLTVWVPGRGVRRGILVDVPQDDEVLIAFEVADAATVVGRVSDTSGRPVARARVMATSSRGGWSGERSSRYTTTADDGSYRIGGLLPGTLDQVGVAAPGFLAVDNAAPSQALAGGAEVRVDLTLVRGGVIDGTVTGPAGEPVAGAEIKAHGDKGRRPYVSEDRTVSEASGRYRLDCVPLGQGRLGVSARGYYQNRRPGAQVEERFDITAEGGRQTLDIVLARGIPLSGRVVDEAGRPVAGAQVTLSGSAAEGAWTPDEDNRIRGTDTSGAFQYEGLPPSPKWSLVAKQGDRLSLPVDVAVVRGEAPPSRVELVLRTGAVLAGRVVVDGRPPETRLRVTVRANDRNVRTEPVLADGTFRIEGLAPQTVEVFAIGRNADRISTSVTRELDWGTVAADIVLEAEALGSISGVVVDPNGNPVGDLRLVLHIETPNSSSSRSTTTTASGRFEFGSLKETGYAYSLSVDGEMLPGAFEPGDHELRFVHEGYETVYFEGRVRLPDGSPVIAGRATVYEVIAPRPGNGGERRGQGASILAGKFSVRIERRRRDSTFEIEVREVTDQLGQPVNVRPLPSTSVTPGTPIEIDLEQGLLIAGRVEDDGGAAVPGVRVELRSGETRPFAHFHGETMSTRADGTFRFASLGPGKYELAPKPGEPWVRSGAVPVEAGDADVVITLARGVTLVGRVVRAGGAPIAGSGLQYSWTEGGTHRQASVRGASGADGTFEIKGVAPGVTGVLTARPPRENPDGLMQVSLADVASDAKDLVLTLPGGVTITGEVTDPDGEPVAHASIWCQSIESGLQHQVFVANVDEGATAFVVGPMPPGRYRLTARVGGELLSPEPIDVTAPTSGLRIAALRGHVLRGKVEGDVDRNRTSVQFVTMTADGPMSMGGGMTHAGEFSITLKDDAPGTIYVQERDGTRYGIAEMVRPSEGPFTIRMREGLTISGRIEGYAGPGDNGYVYLQAPTGLTINAKVAEDGTWAVRGVPPGDYDVLGFAFSGWLEPHHGVPAGAEDIVLAPTK